MSENLKVTLKPLQIEDLSVYLGHRAEHFYQNFKTITKGLNFEDFEEELRRNEGKEFPLAVYSLDMDNLLGSLLISLNFSMGDILEEREFCAVVLSVMADNYPDFRSFLEVIMEFPHEDREGKDFQSLLKPIIIF